MSAVSIFRTPLISLIILSSIIACGHSRGPGMLDSRAIAIWHKHEEVFKKALDGHQDDDEFDQACLFFEQTTRLQIHVNYSTVGALPLPETSQDLIRLQAWYKINQGRLYWDESTQTVKVHPQ
jgi:hypothetical protein